MLEQAAEEDTAVQCEVEGFPADWQEVEAEFTRGSTNTGTDLGVAASSQVVIEAVTEAVRVRLRPIMMSTITTVAGLSPLVFNPGAGTELYRGLGAIVLFGLLFSTLVTLTFMPALLSLVLRVVKRLERRGGEAQAAANPASRG